MKINMLLIIATTVGILGVAGTAVAEQTNKAPGVPNPEGFAMDDSGATWGLHEPLKNCVTCHEKQPEQASPDMPDLVPAVFRDT